MRASEQTQAQLACKLQEANNRFNEFLSIASHELKGPLTTLKGNLQLAQRTLHTLLPHRMQTRKEWSGALEKLQRYLERAEHQISMQNRLASDLIDVSRIRAGKLELQMQLCDLRQIVYEVVEDQRQFPIKRSFPFVPHAFDWPGSGPSKLQEVGLPRRFFSVERFYKVLTTFAHFLKTRQL